MKDARRWWESKQKELKKNIEEALKNSYGEEKTVMEIMKVIVENARVKED